MTEPVAFGFSFDATRLVRPPQDRLRAAEQRQPTGASSPPPEPSTMVRAGGGGVRRLAATDLPAGARTAACSCRGCRRAPPPTARRRWPPAPASRPPWSATSPAPSSSTPNATSGGKLLRCDRCAAAGTARDPAGGRRLHEGPHPSAAGRSGGSARRVPGRARRCRGRRPGPDGPRGRKLRRRGKGRPHRGGAHHARALADRRSWTTRQLAPSSAMPYGSMPSRPRANRRSRCCRCARWRVCWSRIADCWPGRSKIRWSGACSSPTPSRERRRVGARGRRGRQRAKRDRGGAGAARAAGRGGDRPPRRTRLPDRPLRRRRAA